MGYRKWLEPMESMVTKWVEPKDWDFLANFDHALSELSRDKETNSPLKVKELLASQGYSMVDIDHKFGGKGQSSVLQALIQFVCGYHGLDYRDVAHIAHGRMIVLHGSQKQRDIWIPRMNKGQLIGIAATEERGGSHVQNTRTIAKRESKKYLLSGKKCWISRIKEASLFVVYFRFERDETLSAALVEPNREGFKVESIQPLGLHGWSWGKISFENVLITDEDLLGVRGNGLAIFKEHFAYYRPMVAITALGLAAAVIDEVLTHTNMRVSQGYIREPKDTALEILANHYTNINAGILTTLCAVIQNIEDTPHASLWSRSSKAWSVERAYNVVSDLALLMGATSFQSDHFVCKAFCDLRGLLFADGIHDALKRSSGRSLMDDVQLT